MKYLRRQIIITPFLLGVGTMLAGCSGQDDLRVENNYSFPIVLHFPHNLSEMVPAQSTVTFSGKAGYKGADVANTRYGTEQGKTLGRFSTPASGNGPHEAERGDPSSLNGAATWSVTVGPT